MSKNYLISGLIIVAIGGGIYFFSQSSQNSNQLISESQPEVQEQGVVTGKIAQDFSLTTIEGKTVKLSDFRGNYVLFAFMATWCVPCQIEADNARKAQEKNDFVVIQIDIDAREKEQDLREFREKFGQDDWLMGFDKSFEIANPYQVRSFDTTLVVDPEGKIIYRDEGWPIDVKTLGDLLEGGFQQLVFGSTHEHAKIEVMVKNEVIDFSQEKYQLKSPYVHFEDKDGETLHIHAKGVTLKYSLESLGWNYSFNLKGEECLKTDIEEFCDGKLLVTINGEAKDLSYQPKEGDVIKISYQ